MVNYSFTPHAHFKEHVYWGVKYKDQLLWGDKERPGEWNSEGHSHNYERAKDLRNLTQQIYADHLNEKSLVEKKRAELVSIKPLTSEDKSWQDAVVSSIDKKLSAMTAEADIRKKIRDRASFLAAFYESDFPGWAQPNSDLAIQRAEALAQAAQKWHPGWQEHWNILILHFYELRDHMVKNLAIYPWVGDVYEYLNQSGSSKDYAPDSASNPLMKRYDPCISCIEADISAFKKGLLIAAFQMPKGVCHGRTVEIIDTSYGSKGIVKWEWSLSGKKPMHAKYNSGKPFIINTKKIKPGKYKVSLRVTDKLSNPDDEVQELEVCQPKASCMCCLEERYKNPKLNDVLTKLEEIANPSFLDGSSLAVAEYAEATRHYLDGSGKYQQLTSRLMEDLVGKFQDSFLVLPYVRIRGVLPEELAFILSKLGKKKGGKSVSQGLQCVIERVVPIEHESFLELAEEHPLFGPDVHARAQISCTIVESESGRVVVECKMTSLRLYVVDNMDFAITASKYEPVFAGIGKKVQWLAMKSLQEACCVKAYQRSSPYYLHKLLDDDSSLGELIVLEIPENHPDFYSLIGEVDWKKVFDWSAKGIDFGVSLWENLRATIINFGGVYRAVVTEYKGENSKYFGKKYLSLQLDKKILKLEQVAQYLKQYKPAIQAPGLVKSLNVFHWQISSIDAVKHGVRGGLKSAALFAIPFEAYDEYVGEGFISAFIAGSLIALGQGVAATIAGTVTTVLAATALGAASVAVAPAVLIGAVVAVGVGLLLEVALDEQKKSILDGIRTWVKANSYGEFKYSLPVYPGGVEPWKELGVSEVDYRLSEPWDVIFLSKKHIKIFKKRRELRVAKEKKLAKALKAGGRLPAPESAASQWSSEGESTIAPPPQDFELEAPEAG